jgi:prepilin-type N-terminal cleavage/methylation domain-containing protein
MGPRYVFHSLKKRTSGFTIVELLIVITVIGILASIVIVVYSGVQDRARDVRRLEAVQTAETLVETYYTQNGEYPKTTNNPKSNWHAVDVRSDNNCPNGSSQADWIPGVTENLPQSMLGTDKGVDGLHGCYLYVSNGSEYVISAWNMLNSPQSSHMYRRVGFREFQSSSSTQFYTCNSNTVGGDTGGYTIAEDYYKHSYTVSNISDCDETPPAGG